MYRTTVKFKRSRPFFLGCVCHCNIPVCNVNHLTGTGCHPSWGSRGHQILSVPECHSPCRSRGKILITIMLYSNFRYLDVKPEILNSVDINNTFDRLLMECYTNLNMTSSSCNNLYEFLMVYTTLKDLQEAERIQIFKLSQQLINKTTS